MCSSKLLPLIGRSSPILNWVSHWRQYMFGVRESLITPHVKARSGEMQRSSLRNLSVSQWHWHFYDTRESLIPPRMKAWSGEIQIFLSRNWSVSHWHADNFDIGQSLIRPSRTSFHMDLLCLWSIYLFVRFETLSLMKLVALASIKHRSSHWHW